MYCKDYCYLFRLYGKKVGIRESDLFCFVTGWAFETYSTGGECSARGEIRSSIDKTQASFMRARFMWSEVIVLRHVSFPMVRKVSLQGVLDDFITYLVGLRWCVFFVVKVGERRVALGRLASRSVPLFRD